MREESQEGCFASLCQRFIGKPVGDPDEVQRCRREHVLQVGFRQADVAGVA
jgi:hypothetical protein